jgi:sugar-specific transcriptional regulator TrmB
MERNLIYELQQIGLDKSQAAVYLAALELGPSPVQKIAQRGKVPRATTYLVLDELKKKGLVSTYEQGKKIYYNAQHPSQLEGYLKKQESELQIRQKSLESLIPELEQRGQFPESVRPRVKYYEGKESFPAFRRDLLVKRSGQKEVFSVLNIDGLKKVIGNLDILTSQRVKEGVRSRVIFVDPNREYSVFNNQADLRMGREVDSSKFPVPADISIIGDSIGFMPYGNPFRAVIIDDPDIAKALKTIFELAWMGTDSKK